MITTVGRCSAYSAGRKLNWLRGARVTTIRVQSPKRLKRLRGALMTTIRRTAA